MRQSVEWLGRGNVTDGRTEAHRDVVDIDKASLVQPLSFRKADSKPSI